MAMARMRRRPNESKSLKAGAMKQKPKSWVLGIPRFIGGRKSIGYFSKTILVIGL